MLCVVVNDDSVVMWFIDVVGLFCIECEMLFDFVIDD